jgi:hypothetical protein
MVARHGSVMPGAGNAAATGADRIVDVWRSNLYEEFKKIRLLVKDYPYVAMVS